MHIGHRSEKGEKKKRRRESKKKIGQGAADAVGVGGRQETQETDRDERQRTAQKGIPPGPYAAISFLDLDINPIVGGPCVPY